MIIIGVNIEDAPAAMVIACFVDVFFYYYFIHDIFKFYVQIIFSIPRSFTYLYARTIYILARWTQHATLSRTTSGVMRTTPTTTFLASSSPSDLKLTLQELSSPRSVQTHSSTYYENNQEVAGTPKSDGCCSRVFQSPNNQPITYENMNISPG